MFADLRLRTKLGIGFGVILMLVILVGAVSYLTLYKSSAGFDHYRALARDTNLAGRVQANLLMARMNAKNFILTSNPEVLQGYAQHREKIHTFMQRAQNEIENPERAKLIDRIDEDLNGYDSTFEQIVTLINKRNELVKKVMNVVGPRAESVLTQILTSARADEDMGAAYAASMATRNLLLARLYAAKFLDTNDHSAVERVAQEFAAMQEPLAVLDQELQNPLRRELLSEIVSDTQAYRKAFTDAAGVIQARNKLIHEKLDVLGEEDSEKIEQVKLSIKNVQDTLGPQLQKDNHRAIQLIMLLVALAVVVGLGATVLIVRSLTRPLIAGVEFAHAIAQGDFSNRMDMRRRDEIGLLTHELDNMAESLARNAGAAKEIAAGNLDVEVSLASDKDELGLALKQMVESLNDSLAQVQVSSEQISTAANEISDSSQSLSQGATESASSLEQISSSLNELASQTTVNADNSAQANGLAEQAAESAQNGNNQMQAMVAAMEEINKASQGISGFIKTIDEIAFQTNLLALNAAVEAARAGEHGKGFAVVAEEVRSLAARSAKAAEETSLLIEGSVEKVSNGSQIASKTAEALQEIVANVSKVRDLIADISIASNEQSDGVNQINIGVSQIDEVTQQNTASAEQSAAASEELSGQAVQLQSMLKQFRLKNRIFNQFQPTMSYGQPGNTRSQNSTAGGERGSGAEHGWGISQIGFNSGDDGSL